MRSMLRCVSRGFSIQGSSGVGLVCVRDVGGPSHLLFRTSSLVHGNYGVTTVGTKDSRDKAHTTSSRAKTVTDSSSTIRTLFHGTNVIQYCSQNRLAAINYVFALPRLGKGGFTVIARTNKPKIVLASTLSGNKLGMPGLRNPITRRLGDGLFPKTSMNGPVSVLTAKAPRRLDVTVSCYRRGFRGVSTVLTVFNAPKLIAVFRACRMLRRGVLAYGGPLFAILPSIHATNRRITFFLRGNRIGFTSRIVLKATLSHVVGTPGPTIPRVRLFNMSMPHVHEVVSSVPRGNCVRPRCIRTLLRSTNVPMIRRFMSNGGSRMLTFTQHYKFPIITGIIKPIRGSSMKKIMLGVGNRRRLTFRFSHVVRVPRTHTVVIRPVLGKARLFVKTGCRRGFKRIILYKLNNVFIRILGSISSNLTPLSCRRTCSVVRSLETCGVVRKAHKRGKMGRSGFTRVVMHLSALLHFTARVGRVSVGPLLTARGRIITISTHVHVRGWALLSRWGEEVSSTMLRLLLHLLG